MSPAVNLPQIKISYCVKCKWTLRAVWYQQEILQTYVDNPKFPEYHIPEISLIPSLTPGTFKIEVFTDIPQLLGEQDPILIWERKRDGGFPDSKILKQKIRDLLFPGANLGHLDSHSHSAQQSTPPLPLEPLDTQKPLAPYCEECLAQDGSA